MKPIISVEGLGKSYTIRHEGQTRYKSLREEFFKLPKRLLSRSGQSQEEFWALKDVNFDIMPGERVGIIGRNGAGKSTLLKLLSRITEPTTGRITLRGRVASLLEVGTGFHPELTGRENIFLNGAILGMSRAEVRRKFDEIVDFAGVEKFLDTPVKRYSSGMYVRLAFAVAAHLEPEILIVDEVLAVGDAEFQKKCIKKMEKSKSNDGHTVLLVSHNLAIVENLCSSIFVVDKGMVRGFSDNNAAIKNYIGHNAIDVAQTECELQGHKFRFYSTDVHGNQVVKFNVGEDIVFKFDFEKKDFLLSQINFNVAVSSNERRILTVSSLLMSGNGFEIKSGDQLRATLEKNHLAPGIYMVSLGAYVNRAFLKSWDVLLSIEIVETDYYKSGKIPDVGMGLIYPDFTWSKLNVSGG